MPERINWDDLKSSILSGLDVESEYRQLGVEIVGKSPSAKGWLTCRAMGREDRNPSAAVNVTTGRYRDLGGDGLSLSLFDFAAQFGLYADWKEARRYFAKKVNIPLPKGPQPRPGDKIHFCEWLDNLAGNWARHKPGVTVEAMKASGCQLGSWPAKTKANMVVAMPIYGPQLFDGDPCGWVIWNRNGKTLPLFQGKDQPIKPVRMLTAGGGKGGMMGPGIRNLDTASDVWLVEGPTDAMALWQAMPAETREKSAVLCNSQGASEPPKVWLIEMLKGKKVYIIRDRDRAGEVSQKIWGAQVAPVAESTQIIELPYPISEKAGADFRKWIGDNNFADLEKLKKITVDPAKTEENPYVLLARSLCESLDIEVLGEWPSGEIVLFSKFHRKLIEIRDVDRFGFSRMLQSFGPLVRDKVHKVESDVPGMYGLDHVREAVSILAGYQRIDEESLVGLGCWTGVGDVGEPNGETILVGAGEAAVWDGKELALVTKPRASGRILDISGGESWYDIQQLRGYLKNYNYEWATEVLSESVGLFGGWRWKNDSVDPSILTGLILAAWVQTTWDWRPHVSICGRTKSGKSYLFRALDAIFGGLACRSSMSSSAGIRQAIQSSAKIPLLDEFEKSRHREEILENARASSRGDIVLRGSTHHKSKKFRSLHIYWVTAVETGLSKAVDRNRFIDLELLEARPGEYGKLEEPDEQKCHQLGQKLLAISIWSAYKARDLVKELRRVTVEGVDSRVIESYSVPCAMLATAIGSRAGDPRNTLIEALKPLDRQVISDEDDLLHDILSHVVRYDRGEEKTIAQLVESRSADEIEALARCGMKVGGRSRGKVDFDAPGNVLFLDCRVVGNVILRGTDWEKQNISKILARISDAQSTRRWIAGRSASGVAIPMTVLRKRYLEDRSPRELVTI